MSNTVDREIVQCAVQRGMLRVSIDKMILLSSSFLIFIEKLGNLPHKGIARRDLPASGGRDAVGE